MRKVECPTCGCEMYSQPNWNKKDEVKLYHELMREGKYRTSHHVLPKRFFGRHKFVLELCRNCHTNLEALLIEAEFANKGEKLPEMQYIKITLIFIIEKGVQREITIERLDSIISGLLQSARGYFYRQPSV